MWINVEALCFYVMNVSYVVAAANALHHKYFLSSIKLTQFNNHTERFCSM